VKSLILLWRELLDDLGSWCCTSTTLDLKTAQRRIEHEGLSFLTITLSNFAADFEKSLERGFVDHAVFEGFSFHRGTPRFLGGFLDLVFDRATGRLLNSPSIDAIFAVRQLTRAFSKVLLPANESRVEKAMNGYIKCEQEVKDSDRSMKNADLSHYERVSGLLWADVLSYVDHKINAGDIFPSHGPGSTADRVSGNQKFDQKSWTSRLEAIFPFGEFAIPNWRYHYLLDHVNFFEPGEELPVKVIPVPKTLKTPRIIAMEPTCMMYMQQALKQELVEALERVQLPGFSRTNIVRNFIGFSDQTPNQDLARIGSESSELATLDLSEASDRVSNQLVRLMLRNHPHFAEAVDATRSRKADVPGHGVIRLAKFASMGSALCFPIEAMVFLTIVFVGIERELGRPLSWRDLRSFKRRVRVYGDDIIVPVDYVPAVIRALEDFGLLVNRDKSFWTGKFRESCGKDYYDGNDVSIVKFRRVVPTKRQDVEELVSFVATRNLFYEKGLWKVARYMDEIIRRLIPFPNAHPQAPLLGRVSFLGYDSKKICQWLHRPLVKGAVVSSRLPRNSAIDHAALLKVLLKRSELPFADVRHLEHSGRPDSLDIKIRWAPSTP